MIYYRKNIKARIRGVVALILVATLLLLTGYVYIEIKLKAVVRTYALSEAKTMLINATNRAAAEVLSSDGTSTKLDALARGRLEAKQKREEKNKQLAEARKAGQPVRQPMGEPHKGTR